MQQLRADCGRTATRQWGTVGKGEKGERQRDNDVVGVSDGVEGVSEKLRGKNAIFFVQSKISMNSAIDDAAQFSLV